MMWFVEIVFPLEVVGKGSGYAEDFFCGWWWSAVVIFVRL